MAMRRPSQRKATNFAREKKTVGKAQKGDRRALRNKKATEERRKADGQTEAQKDKKQKKQSSFYGFLKVSFFVCGCRKWAPFKTKPTDKINKT